MEFPSACFVERECPAATGGDSLFGIKLGIISVRRMWRGRRPMQSVVVVDEFHAVAFIDGQLRR